MLKGKKMFTTTEEIVPTKVTIGDSGNEESLFVYGGDSATITEAVKKALGIKDDKKSFKHHEEFANEKPKRGRPKKEQELVAA